MPQQYKLTREEQKQEKQRERIDRVVWTIHTERLARNKSGSWAKDWETATKIVRSPIRSLLYKAHRPFIWVEKKVWEPALHWSDRQALLSLLSVAGNVGLIIAAFSYVASEPLRRDAEVFSAWQTITSAHEQSGSGGRVKALEFLNASPGANWRRKFPWFCTPMPLCTWPGESLAGINLSVPGEGKGVYLVGIQLPRADLGGANLEGAVLATSNLSSIFSLADVQLSETNEPYLRNTLIPNELSELDPFRDCERLKSFLIEKYDLTADGAEQRVEFSANINGQLKIQRRKSSP